MTFSVRVLMVVLCLFASRSFAGAPSSAIAATPEVARLQHWEKTMAELRQQAETVASLGSTNEEALILSNTLLARFETMTTAQRLMVVNSLLEISANAVSNKSWSVGTARTLSGVALLAAFLGPRVIEMRSKTAAFFFSSMAIAGVFLAGSFAPEQMYRYGLQLHQSLLLQKQEFERALVLENALGAIN